VPQALTHGTLECDDKEASAAFYRDLVVLPVKRRRHLAPANRFTRMLDGPGAVHEAHRELSLVRGVTGILALQPRNGGVSFLFSDLDRNWWEVAS
jgi:hypothetical protein